MIGGALGPRRRQRRLECWSSPAMDPGQADIEKARRMVRILAKAPLVSCRRRLDHRRRKAPCALALRSAVQRNIPGVNLSALEPGSTRRAGSGSATATTTASGRWWRRGNTIVVDGPVNDCIAAAGPPRSRRKRKPTTRAP